MSKSVVGASNFPSKKDIFKTVEQRNAKVKSEKAKRIQEWKDALTDLAEDAQDKVNNYNDRIETLGKEIDKCGADEKTKIQKEIAELRKKIKELEKKKYTDKDLKDQEKEIMTQIMKEFEGKLCPYCGEDFGSEAGVKSHLCEKSDGLSDEEANKMNTVAERSANYAENFKKEHGTSTFEVEVDLETLGVVQVEISEEIHHLISVDPYASTLRINRIGNLIGFDVNSNENLISAPSIHGAGFKNQHGVNYAELPEGDKKTVVEAAIEKSKTQFHKGDHSFEPEKGMPSYEKKLVQDMAEIEHEVLEMSRNGCLGQTSEGRDKVGNLVKTKLSELQERVKNDIINFGKKSDDNPEVERFLAKHDYDYYIGE